MAFEASENAPAVGAPQPERGEGYAERLDTHQTRELNPGMTQEEFAAASDQVRQHGWFLTHQKLGEGGGGAAYLCVRHDFVSGLHARTVELANPESEVAHPAVAEFVELLARAPQAFGVFKFSKHRDARFRREIKALTTCKHRHLVNISAHDQSDEPAWYVMDYYARGTADTAWEDFRGSPAAVLRGALGIARALGTLHAANLIHRDIKPENIFIASDGSWVLGDLGIALDTEEDRVTAADERRPPMNRLFRPDWAVARPQLGAAPTYDIFQLAAVVHALIAGPNKTPPASQIDDPNFSLPQLHPDAPHVKAVQQFVREHVVTQESQVKSRTAAELVERFESLLALFDQRLLQAQMISWFGWPMALATGQSPSALDDFRFLLPANTLRLRGAIRLYRHDSATTGRLHLMVDRQGLGTHVAEFNHDVMIQQTRSTALGDWLEFEMPVEHAVGAGWSSFHVVGAPPMAQMTGLTLFAEFRA